MMLLRSVVLVCGLLIFGAAAMSPVHGETVVGVNVVNPQRLRSACSSPGHIQLHSAYWF